MLCTNWKIVGQKLFSVFSPTAFFQFKTERDFRLKVQLSFKNSNIATTCPFEGVLKITLSIICYLITFHLTSVFVSKVIYCKVSSTNALLIQQMIFCQKVTVPYISIENPLHKQSEKAYMCFKMS